MLEVIPDLFDGYDIESCFNCSHFGFSGMSFQMSSGYNGYCEYKMKTRNAKIGTNSLQFSLDDTTTVYDLCAQYEKK